MAGNDITDEQLLNCSNAIVDAIIAGLSDGRGVHIETALTAAGALAGLAMLRNTDLDLSKMTPGEVVLYQGVDDQGPELIQELSAFCDGFGFNPQTGWDTPVPEEHQSLQSVLELNTRFEHEANAFYERFAVPLGARARVAAFTGVRMMKMASQVLNPEIGKAILLNAVVAGSKTVPNP